jgi:cardiolipin synthase
VLGDDEVGAAVAAALAQQARAGVRVRLLVDAIGNLKSAHRHDALLKSAGVQTRLFVPALGFPGRGRTNLRNHRKLVVADGTRLWAGGRNIANEYFIGRVGEPPWLDLSFVAEGALAAQALALFEGDWQIARGARKATRLDYAERWARHEAHAHDSAAALPPAASTLPRWRSGCPADRIFTRTSCTRCWCPASSTPSTACCWPRPTSCPTKACWRRCCWPPSAGCRSP